MSGSQFLINSQFWLQAGSDLNDWQEVQLQGRASPELDCHAAKN
jgi:hypothetical protein